MYIDYGKPTPSLDVSAYTLLWILLSDVHLVH